MRRLLYTGALAALACLAGCKGTPDGVLAPDRMAALMADMRVAGAVTAVQSREYRTDSSRMALRQAVLDRHGVTQADFDSSLVWYGHNIGKYQEVTEQSIRILEDRLAAVGSAAAGAMSVAGDSVDVWSAAPMYVFTPRSVSPYLTFGLDADRNSERGDTYIWRIKLITPPESGAWALTAEYADGAVEVQNADIQATAVRPELTFHTDSTRELRRIHGWLRLDGQGQRPVYVDSVSLVRRRADGQPYGRNYRQIMYYEDEQRPDTAAADTTAAAR